MKKMLKLFGSLFLLAAIFTGCSHNSADPNKDDGETVEQIIERYKDWGTGYSTDGKFKVEIKDGCVCLFAKNDSGNYEALLNPKDEPFEFDLTHKIIKSGNNKLSHIERNGSDNQFLTIMSFYFNDNSFSILEIEPSLRDFYNYSLPEKIIFNKL